MPYEIVKLRSANGSTFVTIPKGIANEISSDVTHLIVFFDDGKIVLKPMEESV